MNISNALVIRLNELMQKEGISVDRLSQISGVSVTAIKDIRSGKTKTTGIDTIYRIARGLDISLRDFFDSDYFDE